MKAPRADGDERIMNSQGLSVACHDLTERYTADGGDAAQRPATEWG